MHVGLLLHFGTLETSLALSDKLLSRPEISYDYSERHMTYATTRDAFLNGMINENGFTKELSGGNFSLASTYLANGSGAVLESDLPFEDNENPIDITKIQNKDVVTTLIDTVEFETPSSANKSELMTKMKEHITNYGGIFAGLHGAQLFSDNYNNETGAIYCRDSATAKMDHAAVIIGWNDNYDKLNFNEKNRPTQNGAWIIKNSWGSSIKQNLTDLKEQLYNEHTAQFNNIGINSADAITNDSIIQILIANGYGQNKVSIVGNDLVIEIGNKGFMYVSYEDVNIYESLYGIQKASAYKDYDNLYQHDILGMSNILQIDSDSPAYLANVFTRDSSKQEELTKISVYTNQNYTCKVFVNPDNDNKSLNDLKEVTLAAGDTESFGAGFHTIEFAEPVKLTGNSFVVAIKILNSEKEKTFAVESKIEDSEWKNAVVNQGESFVTNEDSITNNEWTDLATSEYPERTGNLCIKAYTNLIGDKSITLTRIDITQAPQKTIYTEGENFDPSGMEVTAFYSNGSFEKITDYTILDGDNLTYGKNTVTISYEKDNIEKTVTQEITVKKALEDVEVTEIEVDTPPTKLSYIQNTENLNLAGGTIKVFYSNGTNTIISMADSRVSVTGFDNRVLGTQTLTVTYSNKTTTFAVEITEAPIERNPVSSDFSSTKADITEATHYFFSKNEDNNYSKIKLNIYGIKLGSQDDTYTYYYYLSGTSGDRNIPNSSWTATTSRKENDGTYSIALDINTKNIKNYNAISQSDNLFIYIKEIAEIDGKKAEVIKTIKAENKSTQVFYLDGKKLGSLDEVLEQIDKNNSATLSPDKDDEDDNTMATGKIPQTGVISIGSILICIVSVASIFIYRKYKNIDT